MTSGWCSDSDPAGPWPLSSALDIPPNQQLSDVLRQTYLCAHSDIAEILWLAEKRISLSSVHSYFPAPRAASYELRYTDNNVVFLLVYGQSALSFRLSQDYEHAVLDDDGEPDSLFGRDWYVFSNPPFKILEKWYLRAASLADSTVV